ncbi:MAG: TonB-dependent receptor, partial [Planctomycetota bacterium]
MTKRTLDAHCFAGLLAVTLAGGNALASPQQDPPDDPVVEAAPPEGSEDAQAEAGEQAEPADEVGDVEDPLRMPPVVVTARRFRELAQEVPISVTLIPEQTLEDAGINEISDASILVPNMNMVEFTSRRLSFPFIRGIGSGQGDPAVVTYIDGVPQLTVSSTNVRLIDMERVEILRGPQGTLYGRNALGGVINLFSKQPTNNWEFRATGTFGDYDLRELELALYGPLIKDELFFGFSGLHS